MSDKQEEEEEKHAIVHVFAGTNTHTRVRDRAHIFIQFAWRSGNNTHFILLRKFIWSLDHWIIGEALRDRFVIEKEI